MAGEWVGLLPHTEYHHRTIGTSEYVVTPTGYTVVVVDGEEESYFIRSIIALVLMPLVFFCWCALVYRGLGTLRSSRFYHYLAMSLCVFGSCVHNADNILRPALYFTPDFIYRGEHLFVMEAGGPFWFLISLLGAKGLFSDNYFPWVFFACLFTSVGPFHYLFAPFTWFSLEAHLSIFLEFFAGLFCFLTFCFFPPPPLPQEGRTVPSLSLPTTPPTVVDDGEKKVRRRSPRV